jgi:hypothetical protein
VAESTGDGVGGPGGEGGVVSRLCHVEVEVPVNVVIQMHSLDSSHPLLDRGQE